MIIDFLNRGNRKLSSEEFNSVSRNIDGDIHEDIFAEVWIFSTKKQKELMTGDDQSRGYNLDEELRCLMNEF